MSTIDHLSFQGYDTRTFAEIFPSDTNFAEYYNNCGAPTRLMTGVGADGIDYSKYNINAIYFLLISNFANSHIASYDENRFKLQVMSIIYESGPAWQKAMGVQEKLLEMGPNEIMRGSHALYTHNGNWGRGNTSSRNSSSNSSSEDITNQANHPDTAGQSASNPYAKLPYISSQQQDKVNNNNTSNDNVIDTGYSNVNEKNTAQWTKDTVKGWVELLTSIDEDLCKSFIEKFKKLFVKVGLSNRPPLMYVTEGDYD